MTSSWWGAFILGFVVGVLLMLIFVPSRVNAQQGQIGDAVWSRDELYPGWDLVAVQYKETPFDFAVANSCTYSVHHWEAGEDRWTTYFTAAGVPKALQTLVELVPGDAVWVFCVENG